MAVLGSLDACRRVAYENVEDAVKAGLDYAELRFSPYYMAMNHKLPVAGVVEAVIDGITAGCRDFDTDIRLIGIMSRTFGTEACQQELDALLSQRDRIVALDLAGDELGHLVRYLLLISDRRAMPAGTSRFTPVKQPVRKVSGRRLLIWVPSVSDTA